MSTRIKAIVIGGIAAGLLLAAAPSHAQQEQQQQNLSEQEVRSFLERSEQEITQAMQAGDYQRLLDWTKTSLADGATFDISQEIYAGNQRKGFIVTSLDKNDVLTLGRIVVGALSGMRGQPVQDYSLNIEVLNVTPTGPNTATVETRMTESGKLVMQPKQAPDASEPRAQQMPQADSDAQKAGAEAQQAGEQGLQMKATAECRHLIRRDGSAGQLMMDMSTCQARTDL